MAQDFYQLLEGLNLKSPFVTSTNRGLMSTEETYKYVLEGHKAQKDNNRIPSIYQFPIGCQLELTYNCNQRCIHCYNQSGNENNDLSSSLTHEEWIKVCHQLGEIGIFQCVISGGEPTLLGDKLFELMDILHSYNVKFIFITNGMLINEKMISSLIKYRYQWFQVSIDGSRPELHDFVRGVPSWQKAIRAADLVKKAGMPLVIAHAVMRRNIDYLEEMIDLAYILGASRIVFGPFELLGRAIVNHDEISLSQEELERIYKITESKYKEYLGRMEIMLTAEEPLSLRLRTIEANGVLLIRPNGDVKFDCIAPFTIGNIRENRIIDIWKSLGQTVWQHPRVIEYITAIKDTKDMLKVNPRVNVDPDERLKVPVGG
ncbi:MAG: radical SAM protein [Firmicutes bacterium]|nr:radical SAM protein [Bacillota bacterium]